MCDQCNYQATRLDYLKIHKSSKHVAMLNFKKLLILTQLNMWCALGCNEYCGFHESQNLLLNKFLKKELLRLVFKNVAIVPTFCPYKVATVAMLNISKY